MKIDLKYKISINKYKIIKICEGKMKKPFTRAFIFVILYMTQDEKKMKHVLHLEFEAFTNMENLIEQHCNNKDCNCVFFKGGS